MYNILDKKIFLTMYRFNGMDLTDFCVTSVKQKYNHITKG